MRANIWTERFRRDQFDSPAKHFLQQQRNAEKIVKRFATGLKLHQDIDIAIVALLLAYKGAKQSQPFHTQVSDLAPVLLDA